MFYWSFGVHVVLDVLWELVKPLVFFMGNSPERLETIWSPTWIWNKRIIHFCSYGIWILETPVLCMLSWQGKKIFSPKAWKICPTRLRQSLILSCRLRQLTFDSMSSFWVVDKNAVNSNGSVGSLLIKLTLKKGTRDFSTHGFVKDYKTWL